MTIPILQTKVSIPLSRMQQVSRPRLVAQLQHGLAQNRKLSVISAPAGFGKTTLALEWVAQLNTPVAWLALDNNDNDEARFLTYIICALQMIEANLGQHLLPALQTPNPQITQVATSLLNEIFSIDQRFFLFLDDYHLIEADAVHGLMTFLLDHLPANLHIVITSRDDPALPLSRLRIRNELTELRAADLAFSIEEATLFFNQVMELHIDHNDIVALDVRTEGWIAGLQVAGLSIKGRAQAERAQFISTFTGSHRYLLDFLAEEVLERQPKAVQAFLLQSSILARLTGPLCDTVVAIPEIDRTNDLEARFAANSQQILEYLEQSNLFISALDQERRWYRFHPLFRDFLRHQLRRQYPSIITALYHRASQWYEENGYISDAVAAALDVADYERAARLIERVAQSTVMQYGEWPILLAWMNALPDEVIRSSPQLSLHYAWGLITNYQVEAAEIRLQDAERIVQADTTEGTAVRGQVAAIRSTLYRLRGDFSRAVAFARQALADLPQADKFWRPSTALNLATITYLDNDTKAAKATLLNVQSAMLAAQNVNFHLVVTGYLAQLQVRKGDLGGAEEIYLQLLAFARDYEATGHAVSATGMAHIGLGDLYRERNDIAKALAQIEQGITLGTHVNNTLILLAGHMAMARIQQAQGEHSRAQHNIQRATELMQLTDVPWTWMTVSNAASQALLWLRQGEIGYAEQIIQRFPVDAIPGYVQEVQQLTTARLLMATERPQRAKTLLTQMAPKAEQSERIGSLIEILILLAISLHALGNEADAIAALDRALTLAQPSQYVQLFVDEGTPMAMLLRIAAKQSRWSSYIQHLLAAFPTDSSDGFISNLHSSPSTLLDPLTNRELEVLRLIATGLTNQEIADQLVIAHGTVRQHINRIYSKLDVKNRAQVILAAQDLKLLR